MGRSSTYLPLHFQSEAVGDSSIHCGEEAHCEGGEDAEGGEVEGGFAKGWVGGWVGGWRR